MGKYRTPSEKSKYYIPKEDYLTAIHYSLRYPLWLAEIQNNCDTSMAIRYDKDRVQTSSDYDPTSETAIRLSETIDKINMVDEVIKKVGLDLEYYLRLGVCYGLTFDQLKGKKMPCERDAYYLMRRHYYYELAKRI